MVAIGGNGEHVLFSSCVAFDFILALGLYSLWLPIRSLGGPLWVSNPGKRLHVSHQ